MSEAFQPRPAQRARAHRLAGVCLLGLMLLLQSCATPPPAPQPAPRPEPPSPPPVPAPATPAPETPSVTVVTTQASYYAHFFDGRLTASGTVFDNEALVAAHPSWPFGTRLRVTNLGNERSVEVEVQDRGPHGANAANGVTLDLSRAAARALRMIEDGIVDVRVEVLEWG